MCERALFLLPTPPAEELDDPNPCVAVWGRGPEGVRCKTCRFLFWHGYGDRRYYKCEKRKLTFGPGTDHRVRWNACGLYEEANDE